MTANASGRSYPLKSPATGELDRSVLVMPRANVLVVGDGSADMAEATVPSCSGVTTVLLESQCEPTSCHL